MRFSELPELLKPFVSLGLEGFSLTGHEACGACPFCGKPKKFYVNTATGQWSCKGGDCGKEGNLYTFLNDWHEVISETTDLWAWDELSEERGIPVQDLRASGLVWSNDSWYIPVRGSSGKIVSFRSFQPYASDPDYRKLRALAGMSLCLYGLDQLAQDDLLGLPVYLCEGEWDALALQAALRRESIPAIVTAVPGASVFKDTWAPCFEGRDVYLCYDNDAPGAKGSKRALTNLGKKVTSLSRLRWPKACPEGYDVRDLFADGASFKVFKELFVSEDLPSSGSTPNGRMHLQDPTRPSFLDTLSVYKKWLFMTPDMVDALRIIYAVILSNQIDGDPLWIHVAGPPGTGKTELLMSCADCDDCVIRSTVTPHSLVSGWRADPDPSLIPHLNGKIFLLKDFTEILNMPKPQKEEVYSVLRGAYDGEVFKQFGNGIVRHYVGYFSMISGVTQAIFGESGTSLGERFLVYHMTKGVGWRADDMILSAVGNVGDETAMKAALRSAAKAFLAVSIPRSAIPTVPVLYLQRLVALAQVVAMLRGSVDRDYSREYIAYRPQHEVGTRIAKQLKKLILSLALLTPSGLVNEECYRITKRVAIDTCGSTFALEVLESLIATSGQTLMELVSTTGVPFSTLRERLEDMVLLGVLRKEHSPNPAGRGAPLVKYHVTDVVNAYWKEACVARVSRGVVLKRLKKSP